jgi:hypothetical protein
MPAMTRSFTSAIVAIVLSGGLLVPLVAQPKAAVSNRPDTPFKLATFEAQGRTRLGMTSGTRLVDIAAANAYVAKEAGLPAVSIPGDMLALIEQYGRVAPRLYEIANYLKTSKLESLPFAFGQLSRACHGDGRDSSPVRRTSRLQRRGGRRHRPRA